MAKNIDVIIYFEHVVRELDACLKLRNELEKRGISSKVASIHFDRFYNILRYKPKMVVLPFFYAIKDVTSFQFKETYGDILILNLHQEQLYNSSTKNLLLPHTDITKNVYHIAWSEQFYNDLTRAGIDTTLLKLTGNPRTDNYYLKLPKRMKPYIKKEIVFIPTSFSWYFVDRNYFLSNTGIDKNNYLFQRKITEETVFSFFSSLRKLAQKFPNKIFILRPHPFDPIEKYTEVLKSVGDNVLEKNIIINREGNIYEWLRISELVISWLSTVALEATIFNKKNIIWQPIKLPEKMQMDFIFLYDHIYHQEKEVEEAVLHPENVEKNSKVRQYALKSFGKVDGTVNASIAEWICDILKKNKISQTTNFKYILKYFFKTLIIDIPKRILRFMNLISILRFYKAISEDLWTVSELDSKYKQFKKNHYDI